MWKNIACYLVVKRLKNIYKYTETKKQLYSKVNLLRFKRKEKGREEKRKVKDRNSSCTFVGKDSRQIPRTTGVVGKKPKGQGQPSLARQPWP